MFVLTAKPLMFSAAAAVSHSFRVVMGVEHLFISPYSAPPVWNAKPSNCPAGQRLQRVAPASLPTPVAHAAQLRPLCSACFPASHVAQVALAALVLPSGPTVPAAHGVPSHLDRGPVPVAWVPLMQGAQPAQRHG